MSNITIYTDSTSDISKEWLEENNIKCINLTYTIDDVEYSDDNTPSAVKEFYDKMRNGKIAKTSACSVQTFIAAFEEELKAGNDVFYTGLSGKLSATYNNACLAKEQLNEKYSNNKVYTIDSISTASAVFYLINIANQMRNDGKTAQEIVNELEEFKHTLLAWASVDDLMHLKRGGRISGATATVGTILNIKPVLILDEEGGLILKDKVKGNKKLFKFYLSKIKDYAKDAVDLPVFIMHSDAEEQANELKKAIIEEFGTKDVPITCIGSIVGSHLGPGSLIICFPATCTRETINK